MDLESKDIKNHQVENNTNRTLSHYVWWSQTLLFLKLFIVQTNSLFFLWLYYNNFILSEIWL